MEKVSQNLISNFNFDTKNLSNKKIIAIGDSVTANATVGGEDTYFNKFAKHYNMVIGTNYAIGGTTATYMYDESNIYKEYKNMNHAIDGVRVVNKAYINNELNDVDYAFIAYGHNDQYFQPPITSDKDNNYDVNSFDSCHSFKGSYKYMINTLRLANPNVKIILLGCTYSEYDKTYPSKYGKTYTYQDYRNAIKELAEEMDCKYIDPWEYMKDYCDYTTNNHYYLDAVHLTVNGHDKLVEFLYKH